MAIQWHHIEAPWPFISTAGIAKSIQFLAKKVKIKKYEVLSCLWTKIHFQLGWNVIIVFFNKHENIMASNKSPMTIYFKSRGRRARPNLSIMWAKKGINQENLGCIVLINPNIFPMGWNVMNFPFHKHGNTMASHRNPMTIYFKSRVAERDQIWVLFEPKKV